MVASYGSTCRIDGLIVRKECAGGGRASYRFAEYFRIRVVSVRYFVWRCSLHGRSAVGPVSGFPADGHRTGFSAKDSCRGIIRLRVGERSLRVLRSRPRWTGTARRADCGRRCDCAQWRRFRSRKAQGIKELPFRRFRAGPRRSSRSSRPGRRRLRFPAWPANAADRDWSARK